MSKTAWDNQKPAKLKFRFIGMNVWKRKVFFFHLFPQQIVNVKTALSLVFDKNNTEHFAMIYFTHQNESPQLTNVETSRATIFV